MERKLSVIETEKEKVLYFPEEISYLLNDRFLPKIQQISKRIKSLQFPDREIHSFRFTLAAHFSPSEEILTHEDVKESLHIQITPIFQEEVDKARENQQKKEKKNANIKED